MSGFGIQKRGTSQLLVKRKGFSSGSPEVTEPLEPKFEDETDEYFTKETRVGKNKYKVEKVKKSDDEIGYRRSKKAKGGSAKKGILIIIGTKNKESKKKKK